MVRVSHRVAACQRGPLSVVASSLGRMSVRIPSPASTVSFGCGSPDCLCLWLTADAFRW